MIKEEEDGWEGEQFEDVYEGADRDADIGNRKPWNYGSKGRWPL
jgi:hypothetical protein